MMSQWRSGTLLVIAVCGVYALWCAYKIFYVLAFTGYTGPGESPSA
jgi:hypothetical protein